MGRRLNVSQPAVITTELKPLDMVFNLTPNGVTEQWYYDNSNDWQPNRQRTPLIITPSITGVDSEANRSYELAFYSTDWYVNEWRDTAYVESHIMTTSTSADYYLSGNTLVVRKNVGYDHAVQIRCVAQYIDPRDSGRIGAMEQILTLTTSKDAEFDCPTIDVLCEDSIPYNPLTMDNSQFTLQAVAYRGGVDVSADITFKWYAVDGNTEVLAETMPFYVSGQGTRNLVVDALYGEEINIVLRAVQTGNTLYPSKVYRSILWRIPDIETNVLSENGGAYRSNVNTMTFSTVVNVKGAVVSEAKKQAHMRFNWKTRNSTQSAETDRGWGERITLDSSAMQSSTGNVLIYPIVYIIGAYEPITYDGEVVTYNSENVYGRFI